MSSSNTGLVVPVAIWGSSAPSHRITCLVHIPQHKLIVSGSASGQLVVWSISADMQIHPRSMLFGHTDKILCMADVSETSETHYVVSASEKELCLWNVLEGTCVEMVQSPLIHTHFQRIVTLSGRHAQQRLLCSGRYPELLVMDPFTFEICLALQSRTQPDWCAGFAVVRLLASHIVDQDQIVLGVTRLGMLRIWTLPASAGSSVQGTHVHVAEAVCETETKKLPDIDDVQCVATCTFNPRTILIVSSRRFMILDASDVAILCTQDALHDAKWIGGDFISADRCIAWATNGDAYLYQLPPNANPDSANYHQSAPCSPTLCAILKYEQDAGNLLMQTYSEHHDLDPYFWFETTTDVAGEKRRTVNDAEMSAASAKRVMTALLVRGDAHGQLSFWRLSSEMLYIAPPPPARQQREVEAKNTVSLTTRTPHVPLIGITQNTSLAVAWRRYQPAGIIDHLLEPTQMAKPVTENNGQVCPSDNWEEDNKTVDNSREMDEWMQSLSDNRTNASLRDVPKQSSVYQRPLVTTSVYLTPYSQLVLGRSDGSIVATSLMHALDREMLCDATEADEKRSQSSSSSHCECALVSKAHANAITCFIYPSAAAPTRFEQHLLLSGGADFSVVMWDVRGFVKQAQFAAHGGPVSRFLLAPDSSCGRLSACVASIAQDNSVLLINVRERRSLLTATAHCAAVVTLKWRPLDGLMLVHTADGAVYVWDVQASMLDRVLHGYTAQDALEAADFFEQLVSDDQRRFTTAALQQPAMSDSSLLASISIGQAFKSKNLQLFKNVAQQRLLSIQNQLTIPAAPATSRSTFGTQSLFNLADVKSQAVSIQGMRTDSFDSEFHVAYFDVEAVIVQLLADEMLADCSAAVLVNQVAQPDSADLSRTLTTPNQPANAQHGLNRIVTMPNDVHTHESTHSARSRDDSRLASGTKFADPQVAKYRQRSKLVANNNNNTSSLTSSNEVQFSDSYSANSHTSGNLKSYELRTPSDEDEAATVNTTDKQALDIARLLIGLLHVRGLDPALDQLVAKRLQLSTPRLRRLAFGHVSHECCLCLLLPGWWNALAISNGNEQAVATASASTNGSASASASDTRQSDARELETISLARWQVATNITTQHLLSILAITNTMISLARVHLTESISTDSNLRLCEITKSLPASMPTNSIIDSRASPGDLDGEPGTDWGKAADASEAALNERQASVRQAWSVLAAYHCALLPDLVSTRGVYKAPNLSVLIQRWQDRCVEIRAASQSLVLNELGRIGLDGRRRECERWLLFMPSYITSQLHAAAGGNANVAGAPVQQPPTELDLQFDESSFDTALFTRLRAVNAYETRRRHATSIVVLGVLAAEFGSEFEQVRVQVTANGCILESAGSQPSPQSVSFPLSALACRALTFILLQAGSNRLPAHSPIRKCAVDLIGRGFVHFEPFLDVTSILYALLDLASLHDDALLTSFVQTGLPLIPSADLCRTARHSLSLITLSRPSLFIVTLAKEVARYNALQLTQTAANAAQAGESGGALANMHPYLAILLRPNAKRLVLRLVQRLIERAPAEVYGLLIETVDIVLFAVDCNALKGRSLLDLFPAIDRFSRSLALCLQSRRLAVGSRYGQLAIYSLNRQLKIQTVTAHAGAVSALAFSADGGRLLATYSHVDSKVLAWQCPMPTLFGIGQSHLKCVKTFHISPLDLEVAVRNQLASLPATFAHALRANRVALSLLGSDAQLLAHVRLARLLWLDPRNISLATSDGHDHKLKL